MGRQHRGIATARGLGLGWQDRRHYQRRDRDAARKSAAKGPEFVRHVCLPVEQNRVKTRRALHIAKFPGD
jgi:hypothetical protein